MHAEFVCASNKGQGGARLIGERCLLRVLGRMYALYTLLSSRLADPKGAKRYISHQSHTLARSLA